MEKSEQQKIAASEKVAIANPADSEKILRELSKISWSFNEWWHKYNDDILALYQAKYGDTATEKFKAYRKMRSGLVSALADLAGEINNASESEG